MRIAILSDIHGNYDALEVVLKECIKYNIEKYIFLRDYVDITMNLKEFGIEFVN